MKRIRMLLMVPTLIALATPVSIASNDDADTRYLVNPVPDSWGYPGDSIASGTVAAESRWWRMFNDPLLDSLVDVALNRNFDIASAVKRVEIARAAVGSARAAYYPNIGVSAGWTKERASGMTGSVAGKGVNTSFFDVGASLSWEIDVFGKVRSRVNAQKANVAVSAAELASVRLSIAAQLVDTYIDLRVAQNEYDIAQEHATSQLAVMRIAEARFEAGIASGLDVAQARTVYYTTTAQIPLLRNTIHADINAIAVLMGENPADVRASLQSVRRLPDYIHLLQAGVPAELLKRRPDIIEARANIDAEAASLGIARKDYLPSLSLNGSIGTQAHKIGDLFGKESFTYSIAPTLSWTVFDGLGRKYAVESARWQLKAAVDNYNLTVLNAYTEVDNALATYYNTLRYITSLETVVKESAESERLSIEKYKDGLAAFLNVANAEMTYLENRNSLVTARGQALAALVNIYKAIGGDIE